MSKPKRNSTGITTRHSRTCTTKADGCKCKPSFQAWVFVARDGAKVYKTFPTYAAAKGWRIDELSKARRGEVRKAQPTTVADAAATLLEGMRDGSIKSRSRDAYKPSTIRTYETDLRLRILPWLGHMKLTAVTKQDVRELVAQMRRDGRSPSAMANALDPLRVIFREAIDRDELSVNPMDGVTTDRQKRTKANIPAVTTTAALLAVLPETDRPLWTTAAYAGLRRGELRALRWSDVDLAGRTIHVCRGFDDREGEQGTKSDAGEREVPMVPQLGKVLAAHKLRTGRGGDDFVFGQTGTVAFSTSSVSRRAATAWKAHNARETAAAVKEGRKPVLVEPVTLHQLRHAYASMMIHAGTNPKVLQELMGHASITLTFDLYGHVMEGALSEARDAADAYLTRQGVGS